MNLKNSLLVLFAIVAVACNAATPTPLPPTATLIPPTPTTARPTREPSRTLSKPPIQTPAWFNDVVLYEIFPRSFRDSNGDGIGDLKGITQQLDYLKSLGVGALWLTPIFESPSYHGYDTTDYFKIEPEFGTEADLIKLVREAHRRNIRILLDYVVAHTSNEHPFFKDAYGNPKSRYADWYRWLNPEHTRYESFAGVKEMPTLNHDNPEVQKYLIDVAKYWMQKTGNGDPKQGIDGYRADYVLNVPHDFWKKLRPEVKALRPDFELLGEAWTGALDIAKYYDNEFDATFDFPIYGDIEGGNDKTGDSVLAGASSAALIQSTLIAESRLYPPGAQVVHFLNNHDTVRAMSEVNGEVRRAKLGATLILTLPPTPMIYYGEEIGMSGTKDDGDRHAREPMDWYAAETGPGMTTWYKPADRFNKQNDGVSVQEELGKPDSLLEYYRALIALRNTHPALRTGSTDKVTVSGTDKAAAFMRRDTQEIFVTIINPGPAASATLDFSETALPDSAFTVTDALTKKKLADLNGTSYKLDLEPVAAYVLQLSPR